MKSIKLSGLIVAVATVFFITLVSMNMEKKKQAGAYLEISLTIDEANRASAAGVYLKYKKPFLTKIQGAVSKELLLRNDDVQVLHGFETEAEASAYLETELFNMDVVTELKPYLEAAPEIRVYSVFK